MKLITLTLGPIGTNCYIVYQEETGSAAVLDPGDEAARILETLDRLGLSLRGILLTHGHFDHVGAVSALVRQTGAPVWLHPADLALPPSLTRPLPETRPLGEGDCLELDGLRLTVLHTPGHTPGGLCFRCGNALFTGDTLFAGSCGRTDLGGDWGQMLASLRRLAALPGELRVYPGHGPSSTLEAEREGNPYLEMALGS